MDNIDFPENINNSQQEISSGQTAIYFTLVHISEVSVEIYDLSGNICGLIPAKNFAPGKQHILIHTAVLGIPSGKYVYYLQIVNENGTSRECKTLTIS